MKRTWLAKYDQHEIRVEKTLFKEVTLFINNEVQDKKLYFSKEELKASLLSSEMLVKDIKVEFKGLFKTRCYITLGNKKLRVVSI